jgi:hypothetical protein
VAIIISEIETPIEASKNEIIELALKKAGIPRSDILKAEIHKTSLDARKQDKIKFVSSVYAELKSEKLEISLCEKFKNCSIAAMPKLKPKIGSQKLDGRIAIAGFGPAGMFAALTLAEYGYKPIVIERGSNVEKRIQKVNNFWNNAVLDSECNVQFGEGGAGTFSDGKLTTRIKDPLCRHILEKFVEFGAPEEILVKAKPHIGTDRLRGVVKALREKIINLGGEILFDTKLLDIEIKNGRLYSISSSSGKIKTDALILAIGHSARDTFEMLAQKGVFMEPKAFSVGARIEHTQESVNKSLYGNHFDNPLLPQGEYQLSYRENERAVYTFCMCPGGVVVPSSSEVQTVVTNGMSEFSRNKPNANSALVVSVSPQDFGQNIFDGMNFAREIEHKAYISGGKSYKAPGVSVGNFLDGKSGLSVKNVIPSYSIGLKEADFNEIFPRFVTDMMKTGIEKFSRNMKCFGEKDAILTAPETRTSSPIRITRNENLQSINIENLYPCGEGAGYAGGIMSAAVDGIRIALKIMENFAPPEI